MANNSVTNVFQVFGGQNNPFANITANLQPLNNSNGKKPNLVLSSIILLYFLFFLNILHNCVDDQMDHGYGVYYKTYYPQFPNVSIQWPAFPFTQARAKDRELNNEIDDYGSEYSAGDERLNEV